MAEKKAASSRSKASSSRSRAQADETAELTAATEVRSAFISGNTFRAKPVQYVVVDGDAIFEGDIVLGTAEQVERDTEVLRAELRGDLESGVIITGDQFRWPGCVVPFDIDPALTNQNRVTDAIAHWQAHTGFRFVAKTAAHTDWVTFRPSTGCSSSVGRRGGQQFVNLGNGCTTGNTIHEIGHTVGLWHEQSREDRDAFVTIHWDKIQAGTEHNFNQHISDGTDVGGYDYGSIMHYPRDAFGINGQETITPVNPSAQIGQRTALSAGDIASAQALCPGGHGTALETTKELAKEQVETLKERVKELIPEGTFKERIKERIETRKEPIKEIKEPVKEQLETAKERIETIREGGPTIAEGIGGGQTLAEGIGGTFAEGIGGQVGGGVGPVVNPAVVQGQLPFAMRTPTVGVPGDAGAEDPNARIAALEDAVAMIAQGQQELLAQLAALLGGGDPGDGSGGLVGPCIGCM